MQNSSKNSHCAQWKNTMKLRNLCPPNSNVSFSSQIRSKKQFISLNIPPPPPVPSPNNHVASPSLVYLGPPIPCLFLPSLRLPSGGPDRLNWISKGPSVANWGLPWRTDRRRYVMYEPRRRYHSILAHIQGVFGSWPSYNISGELRLNESFSDPRDSTPALMGRQRRRDVPTPRATHFRGRLDNWGPETEWER